MCRNLVSEGWVLNNDDLEPDCSTNDTDECGDCVGGNTGVEACTEDCNGDFGGTAVLDNCEQCVG